MREHDIGVTELRKRLGRYVKFVEEGNVVRITKYGKVIGYMLPAQLYVKHNLADLVNDQAQDFEKEESIKTRLVSDLVIEEGKGSVKMEDRQDFDQIREEVKTARGKLHGR